MMIQSIAKRIREGNFSFAELAASVGLSQDQLKNRLELMERQGYIARDPDCVPSGDGGCDCRSCPSCSDRDRATLPVQYHLTEKGKLLSEKPSRE
jgi:hypothetical protein